MKKDNIERGLMIGLAGLSVYSTGRFSQTSIAKEIEPPTVRTATLDKDPLDDYPKYFSEPPSTPFPVFPNPPINKEETENPKSADLNISALVPAQIEKILEKRAENNGGMTIIGAEDEYDVHWENFDFGHNLETVKRLNDLIVKYSKKNQLPPDVVAGITYVESNGYADGNEKTGMGKMGVMPKGPLFPKRPEAKKLLDDEVNYSWGTSILNIILHNDDPETGGQEDMFLSVALYNAGHVDLLLLPPFGWYYSQKVFYSIGMKGEFNDYLERNGIQLED